MVRPPRGRAAAAKDSPAAEIAAWLAAIALFALGAHLFATPHDWASLYLRDLRVYQAAVDAFAAGADPYQPAQAHHAYGLLFTSPPFVWRLYKLVAHSGLRPIIGPLLLAADAASVVAIPVILSRLLLGPGAARAALGAGFFFTAFAGSGFFTALVINNGTPLYALIALALIPAMSRDRWLWFHLAVTLATAFKPFYAAFWIVPVLADGPWGRRWAASAAGLGAAVASYLAPALLAPRLMAEWVHTLLRQTVGEGLLGDNLLGAITKSPGAGHGRASAYAAQLGFSAALVIAALMLGRLDRPRRDRRPGDDRGVPQSQGHALRPLDRGRPAAGPGGGRLRARSGGGPDPDRLGGDPGRADDRVQPQRPDRRLPLRRPGAGRPAGRHRRVLCAARGGGGA